MAKDRLLTEKQQLFLDALFSDKCKGDPVKAKKEAGYSDNFPTKDILRSLKDEIMEAAVEHLHHIAPKAVMGLVGVLDNPSTPGAKETIAAAKELLDRAGIVKTEKVDVNVGGGVLLLPPKQED